MHELESCLVMMMVMARVHWGLNFELDFTQGYSISTKYILHKEVILPFEE